MASRFISFAALAFMILSLGGCAGSRWARSDAQYELKYPEHSDDILQTVKQSVDARFVGGRSGGYAGFGAGTQPTTVTTEIGLMLMVKPWLETRGGLVGIIGSPNKNIYGGGTAGIRLNSPSRLAPFVGLGGYAGIEPWGLLDDSDDFPVTSDDNDEIFDDWVFAIYPEVGLHYWVTPQCRLTSSASYYPFWGEDSWFFSVGFSFVPGEKATKRTDWSGWSVEEWTE